jgi:hypothetical protein
MEIDALDGVSSLVNKSFLRSIVPTDSAEGQDYRFGMLATMRDYGLEQLAAHEELVDARNAYADYFIELTERTEVDILGVDARPQQVLDLVSFERHNLWSALT